MIQEKENNNQLFHPVEPLDAHQMRSDPSLRIYLNRPHAVVRSGNFQLYVRARIPSSQFNSIQFNSRVHPGSKIQGPESCFSCLRLRLRELFQVPGLNMPFQKTDETGWQSAMAPLFPASRINISFNPDRAVFRPVPWKRTVNSPFRTPPLSIH
jgi:hypothetical protein